MMVFSNQILRGYTSFDLCWIMSLHFKEGVFAPLCPLSPASMISAEIQTMTLIRLQSICKFLAVFFVQKLLPVRTYFPLGSVYDRQVILRIVQVPEGCVAFVVYMGLTLFNYSFVDRCTPGFNCSKPDSLSKCKVYLLFSNKVGIFIIYASIVDCFLLCLPLTVEFIKLIDFFCS